MSKSVQDLKNMFRNVYAEYTLHQDEIRPSSKAADYVLEEIDYNFSNISFTAEGEFSAFVLTVKLAEDEMLKVLNN